MYPFVPQSEADEHVTVQDCDVAGLSLVVPQLFESVQVLVCVPFEQEPHEPQVHDSVQVSLIQDPFEQDCEEEQFVTNLSDMAEEQYELVVPALLQVYVLYVL